MKRRGFDLFSGASLALRGAKKNCQAGGAPRRAREPKQVDPKTCRGQSSSRSKKKKGSKKPPKKLSKRFKSGCLAKFFSLNLPAPVFQVLIHQPQGGATSCKTSCQADGFVPHPWKSTTTESYISTGTASKIVGKLRFWMILCILPETRTVSLHLTIYGF